MPEPALDEPLVTALWFPGWYNLDREVDVGETDEWCFWNDDVIEPEYRRFRVAGLPAPSLYFYNTLLSPDRWHVRRATTHSITHPTLGPLERIGTRRFGTYEFQSVATGTIYEVEAEEGPGVSYDQTVALTDWWVVVELGSVSEPLSEHRLSFLNDSPPPQPEQMQRSAWRRFFRSRARRS